MLFDVIMAVLFLSELMGQMYKVDFCFANKNY